MRRTGGQVGHRGQGEPQGPKWQRGCESPTRKPGESANGLARAHRKEREVFHVAGISSNHRILVIRTGFRSHRDARNYMLKRTNELGARFGLKLHVASGEGK